MDHVDSTFWENFYYISDEKFSPYINLKLTTSSQLCGCNIWRLFLVFLLSTVQWMHFTDTPEEGRVCCLDFYCLVVYEDLLNPLLPPMSLVQQNFIWLNYTWYKTINIVGEVTALPLKVMYCDCCLNEGLNFSVAFEWQGDGTVETWNICHHLWQETHQDTCRVLFLLLHSWVNLTNWFPSYFFKNEESK